VFLLSLYLKSSGLFLPNQLHSRRHTIFLSIIGFKHCRLELEPWLIYSSQVLNLFELIYWLILTNFIAILLKPIWITV
jgi:hypothetical protein